MPPVAVLDLNVLVSGLFPRPSVPHHVLQRFRDGVFQLAISPELIGELVTVLMRPHLRRLIAPEAIHALLENIHRDALIIEPTERPQVVPADPDDDELFACALAAQAGYLVSGDRAVLSVKRFRDIHVVSPSAFLGILPHHPA